MGRRTPEYQAWQNMRARCMNAAHPKYARYGGRGITVCPEWDSFPAFFDHIGPRPSADHSLDRIDNERGYEPGNVRWATRREQQLNRSRYTTRLTRDEVDWIHRGRGLVTSQMMADALGVSRRSVTRALSGEW